MARPDDLPASSTFETFLAPGLDRCAFISAWLRAREIRHSVVELAGKRHIVVRFADDAYDPRFRMKTLVAHYDRAECTQGTQGTQGNQCSSGANDNSAACFQLMLFAERLSRGNVANAANAAGVAGSGSAAGAIGMRVPAIHNIRIFFTDGEEAAGTKGIASQGAFTLGAGLRKLKMTEDDVFVFDCTGRGDTLIVSTAGMERAGAFGKRLADLHERTARLAQRVSGESWLRLPTPYSDNAGFLASGIASQVITVLPRGEATALLAASDALGIAGKKELVNFLARHGHDKGSTNGVSHALPETWAIMHTERDNAASLTASAFRLMDAFLLALAELKESAI
jgi:hypothetical protein